MAPLSSPRSWQLTLPGSSRELFSVPEPPLDTPWIPSAEALVKQCEAWMGQGEPASHGRLWEAMGVPGGDFTLSPLSMRLGAMGAAQGVSFYQHELRTHVPLPEHLHPEVNSGGEGWEPQWENGVLTEPRYFSFRIDGRLQCYNPNHRRQWRPHEVMHACSRFFWRPDMTRFEAYLGARLNELLPIVHWYGWDEVFRPVCSKHRGQRLYQEYCVACEEAAKPYWELSAQEVDDLRPVALRHAEHAIEHWSSEWEACLRELESGIRHPVARPRLDASSDALGYVLGHWNRMTAWSMGAWMERFLVPGRDYFQKVEEQARWVMQVHAELLSAEIQVSGEEHVVLKQRRYFQEYAYRLYVALEHLDEGSAAAASAEAALEPALVGIERWCQGEGALEGESFEALTSLLDGCVGEASAFFPPVVAESLGGLGFAGRAGERGLHGDLVREGLQSTFTHFEEANAYCAEPLEAFVESPFFCAPGRLGVRYLKWLQAGDEPLPGEYGEELEFEMALVNSLGRDEEGEHFGACPADEENVNFGEGRLRLNTTARRLRTTDRIARTILGFSAEDVEAGCFGGHVHVGVASFKGSVRAIPLTASLWETWGSVDAGEVMNEQQRADVLLLLERAFVVWLPTPR